MKRFLLWIGIILSCSTYLHADNLHSVTFDSDTRTLSLSTGPTTPTQILTYRTSPAVERTWIINTSTVPIFISSFTATSLSTTTLFAIPAVSSVTASTTIGSVIWTPDGENAPYTGPMYGSANPGGSRITISVFRSK